jgi:hypothetical protein
MLFNIISSIQTTSPPHRKRRSMALTCCFSDEILNIACCGEARPLLSDRARLAPKHFGRARYVDGFVTRG